MSGSEEKKYGSATGLKDEKLKDPKMGNSDTKIAEDTPKVKRYRNKHMKQFPELYRSDVSIHPSYTGLKTLP